MSNPTSNFGWQMPESTDLVTNLPADFEVFGQAVDTDFADLNGGTTGQVLSKTSNTDLDFTWVAPTAGDIEGVTAGTGISGGGTSGTVTVTNDMATTITAAGDIVVGTGSGTYDNLPIGTTNQILTADTTVSPYKVKWAAPAAPAAAAWVGAIIKKSAYQDIDNNTLTAITWDQEDFDTNDFHSTSSNTSRLTVPAGYAGKYLFVLAGNVEQDATGRRAARLYLNGESAQRGTTFTPTTGDGTGIQFFDYSTVINLAVADYVEIYFFQNSGSGKRFYGGSNSALSFTYLGA